MLLGWLKPSRRLKLIGGAGFVVAGLIAVAHPVLLQAAGAQLVHSDPVRHTEYAVLTPDTGGAGDLEAIILFEQGIIDNVAVLVPGPNRIDREFRRRGVPLADSRFERLIRLGIPRERLSTITAGEGGTTDSISALVVWFQERPTANAMIITGVTHSRRFRRALGRRFPEGRALPLVHTTRFDDFRASDWWKTRWTLRGGIVELQKLALDFFAHPF